MSFNGFAEDDEVNQSDRKTKTGIKKPREKLLAAAASVKASSIVSSSIDPLPSEARLSQPPATPVKMRVSDSGKCEIVTAGGDPPQPAPDPAFNKGSDDVYNNKSKHQETSEEIPKLDPNLNKLEAFQEKQKLIEEQNRKRKEMLARAIQDRKKKTDTESKKLDQVHQELEKIDMMLNTDVQYLRKSIEQASLEFMEAQKRYDRAEKEFVESKLHLFSALERKELLTDHLCTIIEQNEIRKAKKLNALMEELQLDAS